MKFYLAHAREMERQRDQAKADLATNTAMLARQCDLAREAETRADQARAVTKAITAEMAESIELAEGQVASERLGGNAVKESFWLGELAALMRMQNVIHASATTTVEAATLNQPMRTKPEPREDFIGRWPHDEIWEFALRWAAVAAGFSVASAMLEQLLAERNAEEGYPGIAADFETCKAHLRRAAEIGAGTVNPDTVAEWKRAASLPNERAEGLR